MRNRDNDGEIAIPDGEIEDPERPVETALNTWNRLEPLPVSADLQTALQATIADPLWLLCRQWQFLEFAGEDCGTPIEVRVEGESALLSRQLAGLAGTDAGTRARDYSADTLPLEAAIESEPVRSVHPRIAVEAGLYLQRIFGTLALHSLRDAFIAAYPLDPIAGTDAGADTAGKEWQDLVRGRALDARKLLAALGATPRCGR